MPSARSQVTNFATRAAMRVAYRRPKPVADYRPQYARTDARANKPLPTGIRVQETLEPVSGQWVNNDDATARTILYLHGGAFILRLPHTHTAFVADLCRELKASAFMPWYRLAPEHPFPAAPEDCLQAYRHLLESGRQPEDITIMGDSAGGNLALSVLHLIRAANLPFPAAVVGFSPITDFAQVSATWRLNKWRDPMYIVQGAVAPQRHYLQGVSPVDPVASPYYGDLEGFPPTLVVVGGVEAMLDDAVSYVKKAVESGVPAKVHIWRGMPHVFLLYKFLPETSHAREAVANWLTELPTDADRQKDQLHRSCVEVFNVAAVTGRLARETNDVYLVD